MAQLQRFSGCSLLGCPSTAPQWLRSPGCTEHPWGVSTDFIPKMALLLLFETSPSPCLQWTTALSSSSHNRHGGWESRDSMREEKTWEKLENSAGIHSGCAMDNTTSPGTGRIFTGTKRVEAEEGVQAQGLGRKCSRWPWGDIASTLLHMPAGRKVGITSPEAFWKSFSPLYGTGGSISTAQLESANCPI